MKILVLLKQTPDTESKITISADNSLIETDNIKYIVNPYDEFAIEEAIKQKETIGGDCEVIIATFGPESAKDIVIKALAMGADKGMIINNSGFENTDALGVAKVLSAVIQETGAQMVFAGKQAIDDDNMSVHVMTAELLGWPHINVVGKLEISGDKAKVEREVEGGQVEAYEVTLPALFGANKSLNSPRYTSLPGIIKAKRKPFEVKTPTDFGLDATSLTPKSATVSYTYPAEKPAGKLFEGEDLEKMVGDIVDALRNEAKVI